MEDEDVDVGCVACHFGKTFDTVYYTSISVDEQGHEAFIDDELLYAVMGAVCEM